LSRFSLPVEECLDNLKRHLFERDEVILQAPPGAGKTTLVPLALLGEPWLANKKILMLEPRPDRRLSHAPGIESQQSYPH
jgi:ATP-dependent helicase HrpB